MNCWSWASELGMEGEIVFINSQYLMTIVILCVVAYSWKVVCCCCWYIYYHMIMVTTAITERCSQLLQNTKTGSEAHPAFYSVCARCSVLKGQVTVA